MRNRKPHSEETKLKMRKSKPLGFGDKISNARKLKIKRDGFLNSKQTRIKMSLTRKGKKHTKEHIEKIRQAHIERVKQGKNNFWKGGLTPLINQIRNHYKSRQWRSDIFTRDNWTCQECGIRGGYLEADHYPKRFSTIFYESKVKTLEEALNYQEFWNINNGRTLC